jgi:hypothetical protein
MGCSLGGLYRGGNLGIRGREETDDLLGQSRVGRQPRKLALPEIEIAPGQPVEIGRIVVFRSHGSTITRVCEKRVRSRKACLVALRHRR